jgi:hypothetical protein
MTWVILRDTPLRSMERSIGLCMTLTAHAKLKLETMSNYLELAGALVFIEGDGCYLAVKDGSIVKWLHLATGKVVADRAQQRIAFGKWDLCIEGLKHTPSETTILLSYPLPSHRDPEARRVSE